MTTPALPARPCAADRTHREVPREGSFRTREGEADRVEKAQVSYAPHNKRMQLMKRGHSVDSARAFVIGSRFAADPRYWASTGILIQGTSRPPAYRLASQVLALIIAVLLGGACDLLPRKEAQAREGARSRAEELLGALRKADWTEAARFVYLDENTRARMEIPGDADREEAVPNIEAWFKRMYGTVRPGTVHSVTIDPSEPTRARVSYRHDDIDAFDMRFANGDWFYVVE